MELRMKQLTIYREIGLVMMGLLQDEVMRGMRGGGGMGLRRNLVDRADRELDTECPSHINGRLCIEIPRVQLYHMVLR